MKKSELEKYGVQELSNTELTELEGGYNSSSGFFAWLLDFACYIGLVLLFAKTLRDW